MPQFFLLSESLYQLFKNLSTVLLNYFKSFQFPVDRISKTWYTVRMKLESNRRVAACAAGFALPRYAELPTVGLYLDQSVQFVNGCFRTFQGVELTASMVSNYVKKGIISHPIKKKYTRDQLACLIYIVVSKNVLSMENIDSLFKMQRAHHHLGCEQDLSGLRFHRPAAGAGPLARYPAGSGITTKMALSVMLCKAMMERAFFS